MLSARTGSDYGLDAAATSIYHGAFPLQSFQQDIWGIPADPIHDPLRLNPEENPQGKGETAYSDNLCDEFGAESSTSDPNTIRKPCTQKLPPEPSHSPLIPFLQDPTNCDSVRSSQLEVLSYDGGVTTAEDTWPQMIGCDQLAFNPSLYAQPTTAETDSASGIETNLEVPQELSPTLPVSDRAPRRYPHPSRGLLDQSKCGRWQDGMRGCGSPLRYRTRSRMPRVRQDRQPHDR